MALRFVTMAGAKGVTSDLLHARATREWSLWTTGYLALVDEAEAGLLMLDFYDRTCTAKVHEIFVLEPFRRLGVANALMDRAEGVARELGAMSLELEAHPLDLHTEVLTLRDWYARRGFAGTESTRKMVKNLSGSANQ